MARELVTTVRLKGAVDGSFTKSIQTVQNELANLAGTSRKYMSDFGERMEAKSKALGTIGVALTDIGKKMTVGLTVPIATAMHTTGKMAGQWQYELQKTRSIIETNNDKSAGSFSKLKESIVKGANDSGVAIQDFTSNVYEAISANIKAGDAVKTVQQAHVLAVAGVTTDAKALDLLTTITNAYGAKAGSLTHISDVLVQTQNRGKIKVNELAHNMGKAIPTAQSYGVSLEQLSASYSVLTQQGISAKYASTYITSTFSELGKSNTKVAKALKEETGKSFKELMDSGMSLSQVLKIIQDHAKKTGVQFTDMFSNINASKGAAALLGHTKSLDQYTSEMVNAKGVTKRAYDEIMKSYPMLKRQMVAVLKNIATGLGMITVTTMTPILQSFLPVVKQIATAIGNMGPGMQKFIGHILLVTAAFGPVTTVLGKIGTVGSKVFSVIGTLGTTFKGIGAMAAGAAQGGLGTLASVVGATGSAFIPFKGQVMLAVAAIAAISAAVVLAIKGIKKLHGYLKKKSNAKGNVQGAYDKYQRIALEKGEKSKEAQAAYESYEATQEAYQKQYGKPVKVKVKTQEDFDNEDNKKAEKKNKQQKKNLKKAVKDAQKSYRDIEKSERAEAKRKADLAQEEAREQGLSAKEQADAYTKAYNEYMNNSKKIADAQSKVDKAKGDYKDFTGPTKMDKFKVKVSDWAKSIGKSMSTHWDNLKKATSTKWEAIKGAMTLKLSNAKMKLLPIADGIKTGLSKSWEKVKDVTKLLWDTTKKLICHPIQTAKRTVSFYVGLIKDTFQNKFSAIKEHTSNSFEKIKTTMTTKISAAHQIVSGKLSAIRNAFSTKLSGAWVGVKNAMQKVKTTFHNALNGIHDWVKRKLQAIRDAFAHPITATVNVVKKISGGGKPSKHAKGGFTSGLAIAGEDPRYPVEAVISFNPAYRNQNVEYWKRAGRMLGVYNNSPEDIPANAPANVTTDYAETYNRLGDIATDEFAQAIPETQNTNAYPENYNRLGDLTNDDFSRLGENGVASVAKLSDSYGNIYNELGDIETDPFAIYGESDFNTAKFIYKYPEIAQLSITPYVIDIASRLKDYNKVKDSNEYTAQVGNMLSYDDTYKGITTQTTNVTSSPSSVVELGGVKFAPVINVENGKDVTAEKIVDMLRDYAPEFTDFVVGEIEKREETNYVDSRTY